ncbi:astacin [Dictyocaulus viviparus]|uniref:Zinc metalloproteinase n=1 Tax=Dictyocaulus viviparus TaxID=29172 RepID=A0A0D8X9M8_DICVI|nr:astacin [Dictyocaulus viviparus]
MRNHVDMVVDHVNKNGDSIEEVNEHNRIDKALYQSDMILSEVQTEEIIQEIEENAENRAKRQAMNLRRYPKSRWPNKRVYYSYVNASARAVMSFEQAVKDWSNATCIDFYQNDTGILQAYPKPLQINNAQKIGVSENPRIIVTSGRGCWSHVGYIGKKQQQLSLGRGCGTAKMASQFNKQSEASNNNYNLTYDYGGVMHYGPMSVSKNRKPVVITRDINYMPTLGSPMISFYEKLMMNVHYECNDCTKETSAACQNGGFPHPRNCMICICPSGYGGDLCDRRPDGCGSVLKANESFQSLVDTVGVDTIPPGRVQFYMCHYWIEAQPGEKIEVILDSFSRGFQVEGCKYAGVEIKTGSDKRYTGYRFCSPSSSGTRLVSTYNVVPIITYNLRRPSTARLRYRSIRPDTDALESTSMPVTSTPLPSS